MQRIKSLRLGQPGLTLFPPGLEGLGELGTVTPSGLYVPAGIEASGEAGIATAQIVVGGSAHPFFPPGGIVVANRPLAAVTEDGWLNNNVGRLAIVTPDGAGGTTIDTMAALFPGGIGGRAQYITTQNPGTAPINTEKVLTNQTKDTLWVDFYVGVSAGWIGDLGGVNKSLWTRAGGTASAPGTFSIQGAGSSPLSLQWRGQGLPTPTSIPGSQNNASGACNITGLGAYTRGTIMRVIAGLTMNSPGAADGVLTVYTDNGSGLTFRRTISNMAYRGGDGDVSASGHWSHVMWNPTFGGSGVPTQVQYQYMSNVYAEVS